MFSFLYYLMWEKKGVSAAPEVPTGLLKSEICFETNWVEAKRAWSMAVSACIRQLHGLAATKGLK